MVGMAGSDVKVYIGDKLIGEIQTLKLEYERDEEIRPMGTYTGTFAYERYANYKRVEAMILASQLRKEKHRAAARAGLQAMWSRLRQARARQTGKSGLHGRI